MTPSLTPRFVTQLGAWAEGHATVAPWTNVYGLARTMMALATATTLLTNPSDVLWVTRAQAAGTCVGIRGATLGCVVGFQHPGLVTAIAVAILTSVIIGWRPRYTCIPHAWVAFSVANTLITVEGGEQVAQLVTLFLIPVALTDARRWHWGRPAQAARPLATLIARFGLTLMAFQICGIYFQACVSKLGVADWANGTAIYYWLNEPYFGMPSWIRPVVTPLLLNSYTLAALTYGSLLVEFGIAVSLVYRPPIFRRAVLRSGMVLHISIGLLMGLPSFAFIMAAALLIYLEPLGRHLGFSDTVVRVAESTRGRLRSATSARSKSPAFAAPLPADLLPDVPTPLPDVPTLQPTS